MQFIFEQIRVGGDRNFGYLLGDREAKTGVLIDPAYSPKELVDRAKAQGLAIKEIWNTHGHGDHTNGNDRAKQLTGAPLAAYKTAASSPDIPLSDNDVLKVGAYSVKVIYTPGHIDDHIVFFVVDKNVLITGDLLFVGKVGGTAGEEAAKKEWDSLQKVLKELPEETTIWPGHDYGIRPSSTLALEKETNPFLLCVNLDEFIARKSDWPTFKANQGLK